LKEIANRPQPHVFADQQQSIMRGYAEDIDEEVIFEALSARNLVAILLAGTKRVW
jgi:hypothetical protein